MEMKGKAKRFAEKAHAGQYRKTGNIPYITHPIRVAALLESSGASDELVCAGYLHDVVEDTTIGIDEIEKEFGERVADLVRSHTEDKSKTWKERKQHTIDILKTAEPEVKQLIIADRLDNLLSLEADLQRIGPDVWNVFNAGYEDQKWYNMELLKHMDDGLPEKERPKFFDDFSAVIQRIFH